MKRLFGRKKKPPTPPDPPVPSGPPMPERCELMHTPSGKIYPLVARYMHFDEERGIHMWMMLLHPDVDGEVTGRTGELGFRFGVLPAHTAGVLGFEFVDETDHEVVRVMKYGDLVP